ncbi:MAG TPA: helix-turn-helix domain-containing protein [Pyrinomonadaceae bacterium]|nr:helix-turn-helix domain-containing protein [Pyrinomonadaceae bacterium]HMP65946.1 helix-turn-helix domain-containing protein [Pyrinomonadaceae bacterium]
MAKKTETNNEFFEELKAGLTAAIEHAKGKRKDLRTTTLPRPPKELSAKEIVKVRSQLNVSQAVFARYLNISTKTVQSWEQGLGKPNGASLKLLTIARKNPKILLET